MPTSITIQAPAKINLALSVGPPEPLDTPDAGMHPIVSWMAAIDLADTLTLEKATETSLDVHWSEDAPSPSPIGWLMNDDLAVRALDKLGSHVGKELNAAITLVKNIPVGGGLGGGSSDAASCFLAANELFELGLEVEELAEVARTLGSDIGFFLDRAVPPRPALVMRFGDLIRRVELPVTQVLLIIPAFGCYTGDVYREYDESSLLLDAENIISMAESGKLDTSRLFNDLSLPAQRSQPELQPLLQRLSKITSEPIHVSGSGSTLFMLTDSADTIAQEISQNISSVQCVHARTLTGLENQ